jgi:uncharacterized protein (DUF302 family)
MRPDGAHSRRRRGHFRIRNPTEPLQKILKIFCSDLVASAPDFAFKCFDMSANGVVDLLSPYPVKETVDRLEALLKAKGVMIFARIDQQSVAAKVGLTMRPVELLIFGDPKAGTPLMETYPSLALDLPLKALAWESADGRFWLSYNSPEYLAARHNLESVPFKPVEALIKKALE